MSFEVIENYSYISYIYLAELFGPISGFSVPLIFVSIPLILIMTSEWQTTEFDVLGQSQ